MLPCHFLGDVPSGQETQALGKGRLLQRGGAGQEEDCVVGVYTYMIGTLLVTHKHLPNMTGNTASVAIREPLIIGSYTFLILYIKQQAGGGPVT